MTDCFGSSVTTTEQPNPCIVVTDGSDLATIMRQGVYDPVLNVTHTLAHGQLVGTSAVGFWVATEPLPTSLFGPTRRFLTNALAQIGTRNCVVITALVQGYVIKDGTVLYNDKQAAIVARSIPSQGVLNNAAFTDLEASAALMN